MKCPVLLDSSKCCSVLHEAKIPLPASKIIKQVEEDSLQTFTSQAANLNRDKLI